MADNFHGRILLIFAFFLLPLALAGCDKADKTASATTTGLVTESTLTDTVESSGSLQADQVATLTWGTSGVVTLVRVNTGDKVNSGDVLIELDATTVPAEIINGFVELSEAKLNLEDAKSQSSTAQAAVALAEAQAEFEDALAASYTIGYQRASSTSIAAAEVALELAKITYEKTSKRYDKLISTLGTSEVDRLNAKSAMINAEKNVKTLQSQLSYLKSKPTELESETIIATLELAKARLESAQRAYDRVKDGPNADDVAVAQSAVDAAQATVNNLKIIAPFDGEVVVLYNQVGDQVEINDNAVILVNREKMFVEISIDETSISNVKVGNSAFISFDAFPGKETSGKVSFINPIGNSTSGVVNYTVRIDLDHADPEILIGATASITIETSDPEKLLFVPIYAVQSDAQGEYVMRVTTNGIERVPVVSGQIVNNTVVVDGELQPGEVVQIWNSLASESDDNSTRDSEQGGFLNGGGMIPGGNGAGPGNVVPMP